MGFNAAALVATIRLDGVEKVASDLAGVRRQLGDTDTAAARATRAIDAGFRSAAIGIGVGTIAAGVFLGKLVATGVAYNTLQQTSRAALATLLGGASAANAQMDKLDAFARLSPFSKSVFITAQQQLLGFGVEAGKVIPMLDAIQQAVAATGGSSQMLSEIAFVLAQISAAGKITGQDLIQLGQRGINAAELIGAQMGKTAAEIKQDITDGALDATVALDLLTKGMAEKFAGASANVKGTFSGTVDRVKAASRDIGAALAEPFVSKNGGGLAVTWGNQLADVMRAVEKHISPVVSILMDRAAPAVADITGWLDRAKVVVAAWDSSRIEAGLDAIVRYAPGLAALAGAILGVNTSMLRGIPIIGPWLGVLGPVSGALAGIIAASPELRAELGALLGAFSPLVPVGAELGKVLATAIAEGAPLASAAIEALTGVVKPLVDIVAAVPTPVLAAAVALLAFRSAAGPLSTVLASGVDWVKRFNEQVALQRAIASATGGELDATRNRVSYLSGAAGAAGVAVTGLGNSMKAAFLSNPIGIALLVISGAIALFAGAMADASQKTAEQKSRIDSYRTSLDQVTGAITDATDAVVRKNLEDTRARDLANEIGVSYNDMVAAILGNEDALARVNKAMDKHIAVTTSGDENLDSWSATATNAKNRVNELSEIIGQQSTALATSTEKTRLEAEEKRLATAAMSDFARSNQRLNEALTIARDVSNDATERLRALKTALDELNGGARTAEQAERDLHEQTNRLADAFEAVDANGKKVAPSLVDAAGAIDTTTAAGISLFDELDRLNDQMLDAILRADEVAKKNGDAGVSMQDAAAAAQPYIDSLKQVASDAGLSQEQVDGLITRMLDAPGVVSMLLDTGGTISEADQEALMLLVKLGALGEGATIQVDSLTDEAMSRLEDLGLTVTTLPDGKVTVTAVGVDTVESAITNLTRPRGVSLYVSADYSNVPASLRKSVANEAGGVYTTPGVKEFAKGGIATTMASGIYAGGPIYKFAEKHLPWETFISGAPQYRARSIDIWKQTGQLLGVWNRQQADRLLQQRLSADAGQVRSFEAGGIVGRSMAPSAPSASGNGPQLTIHQYNPYVRDSLKQARRELGALTGGYWEDND